MQVGNGKKVANQADLWDFQRLGILAFFSFLFFYTYASNSLKNFSFLAYNNKDSLLVLIRISTLTLTNKQKEKTINFFLLRSFTFYGKIIEISTECV